MDKFDLILHDNISPNEEFFYKVMTPYELNKSCWGCRIAFFSNFDESLIYHNSKVYAHEINDPASIAKKMTEGKSNNYSLHIKYPLHVKNRIATWSGDGSMVYMLEYSANNTEIVYTDVFVDLKEQYVLRLKKGMLNDNLVTQLGFCYQPFNKLEVLKVIQTLGINKSPLIQDTIQPINFLDKILNKKKWK